jgi:hypothetical protein
VGGREPKLAAENAEVERANPWQRVVGARREREDERR